MSGVYDGIPPPMQLSSLGKRREDLIRASSLSLSQWFVLYLVGCHHIYRQTNRDIYYHQPTHNTLNPANRMTNVILIEL